MKKAGYIFNFAEIVGGGELSLLDLIDEIRRYGVQPVAFVPAPGEIKRRLENMNIPACVTPWPALRLNSLARLPKRQAHLAVLFKNCGLDLVHVNGARCMLYAGPAARRAEIPCVWHVRVLERDRFLDRIRGRYADVVIANSNAVARSIGPLLPKKTVCQVVYNGIRIEQFAAVSAIDLKAKFGVGTTPVILAVGRFSRSKSLEDLLHACRILKSQNTAFSCLLVGNSTPEEKDYEAELKALAKRLNLENVFFLGWRDDIYAIMKSATVLVLPSRVEAFGRVIPEAWACGLPVVAAAAAGPAELIRNGMDGILTKIGNKEELARAISSVLHDKNLSKNLTAGGRARAQNFSLQNHAKIINDIYDSLLNQKPHQSI